MNLYEPETIEKIRLISKEQFDTLYQISKILNSVNYTEKLISDTLDLVIDVVNAERGLFVQYNDIKKTSKSLDALPDVEYDMVITMGCGDACPWVKAKERRDWSIPDPRDMEAKEFNRVRDEIERQVLDLIAELS